MSSSTSQPLVYLWTHGKSLFNLLQRAENKQGLTHADNQSIHENVKGVINNLLDDINKAQSQAFFPEESVTKLLKKIQATLEDFIKLDTDNKLEYESLAEKVKGFRLPRQFPAAASSLLLGDSVALPFTHPKEEFSDAFGNLDDKEKRCLVCLYFLSATGKGIKKRDVIYCWIGMDLVENQLEAEDRLVKLVSMGFIERNFGNKKLPNRYSVVDSVCDIVKEEMNDFGQIAGEESESWLVMYINIQQQQQQHHHHHHQSPENNSVNKTIAQKMSFRLNSMKKTTQQDGKPVPEAVLNIKRHALNAEAFNWLSKKKHVKVLQLGSFHDDPTNYIMVEDSEVLKDLKNLGEVRFLSLQGISGITKLPDSIYKLGNLKVLDLRACHNLESLPDGIDSLAELTHLDLSECVLLRELPVGIKSLSQLTVLKGFIINPDVTSTVADRRGSNRQKQSLKNAQSCAFDDLIHLSKLRKLTVRTRRMNFPTKHNLVTLCSMKELKNLKIAWVEGSSDAKMDGNLSNFPPKLRKLELQAAPESTALLLLELIGKQRVNGLEKLYIRGGRLRHLDTEKLCFHRVRVVKLRYLPELHSDWGEFRKAFPNVIRVEIFGCPNLLFFPCDKNGLWE